MRIDRKEISALKGLSIIMIVLHNVAHVRVNVGENEFTFNPSVVERFIDELINIPVSSVISFWGWLPVTVFIFASGYGLTIKYGDRPVKILRWLPRHYLKLAFLLLPSLACFVAYNAFRAAGEVDWGDYIMEQLLVLNIINPSAISPMIYWYLGMAIQLYIVFLLLRRLPIGVLWGIAIACYLAIGISDTETVWYMRHNCLGWMPEFIFGITVARTESVPEISVSKKAGILITMLFILMLSSFSRYTFALSGVCCVSILFIARKILARWRVLVYMGEISAALYVTHAVLRRFFSHFEAIMGIEIPPIGAAFAVLALGIVCSIPYQKGYEAICKYLFKPKREGKAL